MPDLLVAVVLAIFIGGCSDDRRGVNPGDVAPDIAGTDLKGAPLSLHSLGGKVVLVNFWATWCGPCLAEIPALQALHEKLRDKGFQVVGIAIDDSPENVAAAQARLGMTYPIILDSDSKSKRGYEIKGLPESYVLDEQHRVLVVQDPGDGTPVTKIIGPRAWSQNQAMQVFEALLH